MLSSQLDFMTQSQEKVKKVIEAEQDFTELYRSIKNATERAGEMSYSYKNAPAVGYFINGEGAIGFKTDLTPCASFNPTTPTWVPVIILCCGQNMTTASGLTPAFAVPGIAVPGGGYTSACTKSTGLSVQINSNKICYPHVHSMDLLKVGYHATYGSSLLMLDLKSNRSLTGSTNIPVRALTMFFGLGNTGASTLTFCNQSLGL